MAVLLQHYNRSEYAKLYVCVNLAYIFSTLTWRILPDLKVSVVTYNSWKWGTYFYALSVQLVVHQNLRSYILLACMSVGANTYMLSGGSMTIYDNLHTYGSWDSCSPTYVSHACHASPPPSMAA